MNCHLPCPLSSAPLPYPLYIAAICCQRVIESIFVGHLSIYVFYMGTTWYREGTTWYREGTSGTEKDHVVQRGNYVAQRGNHVIQRGNHEVERGNHVVQRGNQWYRFVKQKHNSNTAINAYSCVSKLQSLSNGFMN